MNLVSSAPRIRDACHWPDRKTYPRQLVREHGTQQLFLPRELSRVIDVLPDAAAAFAEVPALCGGTIVRRSRHVRHSCPSIIRPERQNLGFDGLARDRSGNKDDVAINARDPLPFAGHRFDIERHACADVEIRSHEVR